MPITIHCALNASQALRPPADIILLPEGVSESEIRKASINQPQAVVAGAYTDSKHCRGAVYFAGRQITSYLKVLSDGRALGSNDRSQLPVLEQRGHLCVGLLVCMDIDDPAFSSHILDAVKSSECQYKVLCIPADMGPEWLCAAVLPAGNRYHGLHVALCNNNTTYPVVRC